MISKSISTNGQLKRVSLEADYLFGRCIPHLDREGRIDGDPDVVKAMTCPLRRELTSEVVERCLGELQAAGLIEWYEVGGQRAVWFPGFAAHQSGLRKDREAESRIPAPSATASLPTNSGVTPDEVPQPRRVSEVKRSEVKVSQKKVSASSEAAPGSSWPAAGAAWWCENVGQITAGRFGKMLKPVVDRHAWDATFAGMKEYADEKKRLGKPASFRWFLDEAATWIELAAMPTTDANGDLTARGKRAAA